VEAKRIVITGATSGLGREAALQLAALGCHLSIVGRNRERTEQTAAQIMRATGNESVDVLIADLSSQADVRRVANELLASSDRLDVLLNNAGAVFGFRRATSVDGIEMTFALNHLAYFTLTVLLMPRLRAGVPTRIVNVTGDAYKDAKGHFDFDDYDAARRYRPILQYGRSKLANILFTRELARRLEGSGISANAVGPARTTATRFAHNVHPLAAVAMHVASPFLLSVDKGAAPIVHLCASPDLDGVNGTYWSGWKQPHLTAAATSAADAERLWRLSAELTGVDLPA
jgi:NAD(P)-dependent dehydrogenase (short-subunit alcohol dehydrogenase family)